MRVRNVLLAAQRLLAWVVLVLSAVYLLVYLYRWEWNRAIISGLFFVAAEVALVSASVQRRLVAVERAVRAPRPSSPEVLAQLRSTPVSRPNPFRWLDPHDGRLGVFVPVLLGAGAVLSALAYLVQRVAEVTALPAADRRLARRLSGIALPPPGELASPGPVRRSPPADARKDPPPASAIGSVLAVGAIAVLGWLGILTLMDAAQTRPDPATRPVRTTIELEVVQRHADDGVVAAAEALWVGCRSTLGSRPTAARVDARGGERVALVLEPGVGRLAERRLTGCLSDLRVNLVMARVLEVDTVPRAG